jgi:hypothetical protein
MAGFVIDIIIEFFFRAIANLVRRIGTGNWPVVTATVSDSERREPGMGCTVIVIHYKFRNAELHYEGTHKEQIFFINYAEAYLRRYHGGSEFPVRYNPRNPACSIPAEQKIVFTRVR